MSKKVTNIQLPNLWNPRDYQLPLWYYMNNTCHYERKSLLHILGICISRFVVEGIAGGKTEWTETMAQEDNSYYCSICNKYMNVKAGERVPMCCGGEMATLD